ncbi:MAG TPA: DUF1553 domain-containing protein [Thermoguttaceae bacterium]|nr:DUF1553 domain-containing protein [Thermoguttaceae bacterium]
MSGLLLAVIGVLWGADAGGIASPASSGADLPVASANKTSLASAPDGPAAPFETAVPLTSEHPIDKIVFTKLKQMGIQPARLCSDEVFLRRVYLDVIGTLPTAEEAKQFLDDPNPRKREALIDRLLEREEFADYWAMKWGDLLRIKAEFPINLWPNAAQAYHRWVRAAIRDNMPYDRFVRELLTANGSNFRVPQVNFYRAVQSKDPQTIAQAVALTFMGTRADKWPKEQLAGMAVFFSRISYKPTGEWKEEIVAFDPEKLIAPAQPPTLPGTVSAASSTAAPPPPAPSAKPATSGSGGPSPAQPGRPKAETLVATFPDGTTVRIRPDQDPRMVFADWLIQPKNPWFAKNIVNRIWAWLLGRGIIHEPDDIRPDNPPSNPELLAFLEKELMDSGYNLRRIYRLILTSKTYQLSSIARSSHPEAAAQFAYYPVRRLEAEVLIDALNQITGTTEQYSSMIPEPFTYIPLGYRAVALPDGSITSAFLEQFGRPPRDSGLEAERNNRITANQRLHLLNSTHIQRKIQEGPKLLALLQSLSVRPKAKPTPLTGRKTPAGRARDALRSAQAAAESQTAENVLTELYLTILSRRPTPKEKTTIAEYVQKAAVKREAFFDVVWALVNSSEFLYRH